MAARLDYLQRAQTDQHAYEMKYCDLVLVGHARWARTTRGPATPVPMGQLLGMPTVIEGRYELQLNDDEFTMVDSATAKLSKSLREIVELEYQCLFRQRYQSLSQEEKWGKLGLRRTEYSNRLDCAKSSIHTLLMPYIVMWRIRGQENR
jgi:hypothetical protein